jgi:peptidyl-dipeptidase Dcp
MKRPDYPKELSKPLVLKQKRKERRLIFTLDHPSYVPFMTYADNRELRKKLAMLWRQRFSKQRI